MEAGYLPSSPYMCDPGILELVWENGQILIRDLSSKMTEKHYFSQYSKNRSKDGIADSSFADPLTGLSGLTKLELHDKNKINSLQTCPELLSELYEDGFKLVFDPENKCNDKRLVDSNNIAPANRLKNFKHGNVCRLAEEIPKQLPVNSNGEVPQSSLKQYEVSIQFMTSKEKKSRIDEKSDRVNVNSIFLRSPTALLESNHPSSGARRKRCSSGLAGVGDLEGNAGSTQRSSKPFDMIRVEPTNGWKNITRSTEKEGNFMARNMEPTLPDSEPQKESLPDEQSEAFGYNGLSSSSAPNTAIKGDPGNRKSVEQMVASSSVCSRRASNCPTYTLEMSSEDTDDLCENAIEEPEGTTKAAVVRGSKSAKRKRKAEVRNLSERKRRDKISKKMRALQKLIPNCNKVDQASMLDEAIEYLKTLQLQVQMMSMGTVVYIPPMMLPSAMQHMNTLRLAGYSPNSVGIGSRMQMGLGCGLAQFPTSLMYGATGFPGQVLLMSMSRSPFVPLAGRFFPQAIHAPGESQAAAAQVEVPGAAVPLPESKDSNPTH